MRSALTRLAALLLALLCAVSAQAGTLDEIKARGPIRIGLEGTYPPFNYVDEKGELVGFEVDLAKALADHLGAKPEF